MKIFIDKPRQSEQKFTKILNDYQSSKNNQLKTKRLLVSLISEDIYFFRSYTLLSEIYQREHKKLETEIILSKAYKLSLDLIKGKRGKLPDLIDQESPYNQHIINLYHTIAQWTLNNHKSSPASKLINQLTSSSSHKNSGITLYLGAIKGGATLKDFNLRRNWLKKLVNPKVI